MTIILLALHWILTSSISSSQVDYCNIAETKTPKDTPHTSISFNTKLIEHHNFCEGEVQLYEYPFKNTGHVPLVITSVRSGCGCYVPQWPKEPIAPGDSGVIKGRYNSLGRPGKFQRSLTVIFYEDRIPRQMLYVKGSVVPKEICQSRK